ncbi:MAG: GH13_8 / GH13_9 / GH13 / GH13_10 / GH13_36 [uncultured Phycisphaerae bacterium]|uniref:1,4-alpha-glucan branching enzyme n=1 Tax=uncultured Phycisphaerae bacterium TaxID=904963 RepID=A0A6J4QCF5_9BACT|nr:MAG: GH13_8 / GH13_9 / GH13 / GH13_10 / GH13_36 [uncultured Phycisphaerae bacterium]
MTTPASPASATTSSPHPDGTGLIAHDPWLEAYRDRLRDRYGHYRYVAGEVEKAGGLLGPISQGHHYFGFNRGERDGKPGVWYREWAPAAYALFLTGDFNGWDRRSHPMARDPFGTWSIFLPDDVYASRLTHGGHVKAHVVSQAGGMDRIPAYVRRVVQDPHTHGFIGQYWNPPTPYAWQRAAPRLDRGLRIYEAHVGMATEEGRVGTYDEFTANVLPRVQRLGYNAIQLMAVMEHPYYGSFGYHVSNFFAVSSRCGTPEELKRLIDAAHGMGIIVLLDVVHSHSVKNTNEGLSRFDGTDYQYFHDGPRGQHAAWDSLLFDYRKYEVQRFLLSNLRYWLEEFRFDGFRFDGVTSMLYLDHGLGSAFDSYDAYFGGNVDWDAVVYLQLANELVHKIKPDAVTIAEDVSGMAGMGRPVAEGGLGFDYRLSMGIPDYWIKLLKEKRDEDWNLNGLYHTLTNRRPAERHVAYAESHDQALVGDKTLAFWLMDQEMYWNMAKGHQSLVVDRGVALHKMIRLITFSLGGEAYLTFMGNEFGHPEWVDFPREGNGYSYHYARRQWSLAARDDLRYAGLEAFDQAMLGLDEQFNLLTDPFIEQLDVREDYRLLVYRRGPLVFVFNFHPTESYTDLRIPVPDPVDYRLALDTDEARFAGFGRVAAGTTYAKQDVPMYTRGQSIQIYIPARTAQVLVPVSP